MSDPAVSESNRFRKYERDARAWELRAEKKPLKKIREILIEEGHGDVKETTISSAIRRVDQEKRAGMFETIATLTMRSAHLNDYIIGQALEAWDKSKKPAVSKKVKERVNGVTEKPQDGEDEDDDAPTPAYDPVTTKEKTKEITYRDGDPKYLAIALQANHQNAKLLGLEQPKRVSLEVDRSQERMTLKQRIEQETDNLSVDQIRDLLNLANKIVAIDNDLKSTVDVEFKQIESQDAEPNQ